MFAGKPVVLNGTFARTPAEVQAARSIWNDIDFFAGALADVTDPEMAGLAIEGAAPRIAQAEGPNFISHG